MDEVTREMTFEEEYEILKKEADRLFATENGFDETPFPNCIVRRALRCINKLKKHYESLEEKEIPTQPILWGDGYADGVMVYDMYDCPNCGETYERDDGEFSRCTRCGQKLDWSEI